MNQINEITDEKGDIKTDITEIQKSWPIMVAHAWEAPGGHFGRPTWADYLRSGIQDQSRQYGENSSQQKYKD